MAEAAIVLPIIIFAVITIVLILMFFYEVSVQQSSMHMALRSEACEVSGKATCSGTEWDGNINIEKKGLL